MPAAADPRPPLDAARLSPLGVEVVAATGSTNALVADRARDGAPEGLVVVTEHQTAGRGRLDRSWHTPPRAALTFSVLLRPDRAAVDWPWLPLLTGVAAVEAMQVLDVPAELKWPNDVLVGGRKVAGILAERIDTPTGAAAVLGVGINVSTTRAELPVETATSIELATGHAPDRTALLEELVPRLRRRYAEWAAGGGGAVRPAYLRHCATLGRQVRVALPADDRLTGTATDVDLEGRLLVDGTPVAAGDVVHVRPAE